MLIISQDKETLVSLDNISLIAVDEDEPSIYIAGVPNNARTIKIGSYNSRGRCKEVLEMILQWYARACADMVEHTFEMPEE